MQRRFVLFLLWGLCISPAYADVKLHGLFTDHMVLQQKTTVPVWGLADPDEKVTVKFQNQSVTVQADAANNAKLVVSCSGRNKHI